MTQERNKREIDKERIDDKLDRGQEKKLVFPVFSRYFFLLFSFSLELDFFLSYSELVKQRQFSHFKSY